MVFVLFGQKYLLSGYAPIDIKIRIIPCDSTLTLWSVEFVTLVLEDSLFTEYGESMSEALPHEELEMIFLRQFYGNMLAVSRRTLSDINGYIAYLPFYYTYQFALCVGGALKM